MLRFAQHNNSKLVHCGLVVMLLVLAVAPPSILAAEPPWGAGQQTATLSPAYVPRIAYDREGFLHMVFFSGPSDAEWEIYYTNNRVGAWAPALRISDGGPGSQRNPDIAVGPDGRVHVAFERRFEGGRSQIFYVDSPDLGASWSVPRNFSNTPGRAFEPALAVDPNGTLHAVWIDSRWADILQATYATRPAGGEPGAAIKLGSRTADFGPDLTTTGSGGDVQVHIVFSGRLSTTSSTSDNDIFYTVGVGGSFALPANLSRDGGEWSLTPTIASDGGANLFLAWDTEGNYHDIVFARSSDRGRSWSAPVNVASRATPALNPVLAVGQLEGRARAHLAWTETLPNGTGVLYLGYDVAANSFATVTEIAAPAGVFEASVAGSPTSSQAAVAYRGPGSRPYAAIKGVSNLIAASLRFDDQNGFTRRSALQVTLGDFSGEPVEMRYALDRLPSDADPWRPLQASFGVEVPPSPSCARTLYLQLRTANGRLSQVFSRSVVADSTVQARLEVRGQPDLYGAHPDYTPLGNVQVVVSPAGECVGLRYVFVDSPAPFLLDQESFAAVLPLAGEGEGTRQLTVRVQDDLGNELALRRAITVDTSPPELLTGTLAIDAPPEGLPTPRATLRLNGLEARDNFFPGGYWALLVANTADPSAPDEQLRWTTLAVAPGGEARWSLQSGLERLAPASLAGQTIQVRARLLDGAGNPSAAVLTATVRLAENYRLPGVWVPIVAR
jgi:hypothetical protein